MLTHLRIRNLALAVDLSIEFQPGFNAVTGETGAGKSMIIGALNLLLGARADRTLIRAGADACSVEAVLDIRQVRAPLAEFLAEHGLEPAEAGQLLLKRTLSATGANRQFINGSPAPLQTLAELGEWLVDLHGPHDHQSLFHPARQLALLDAQAGLDELRSQYAEVFLRRVDTAARKAALIVDEATYARQLDLLRHQAREIEGAGFQPGDDEHLETEHRRVQNAARLLELAQGTAALLHDDDDAVIPRARQAGRLLQDLVRLDPSAEDLATTHASVLELLQDLHHRLSTYTDRLEVDPARLQELDERLNLLHSLRRKYGATVEVILEFGVQARAQLEQLEGRDAEVARLNAELEQLDAEIARRGAALTAARRKAIPRLAKAVSAQLKDLGFRQSEFGVALQPAPAPQRTGCDVIEFQFAPNPGEPARPLRAIASSGELARVMLGLKTVLAAQDDIPVVVFDEVDANIGGETAHAVGAKMRDIGRRRQVICITHLAPVAAAGDAHFVVSKATQDGRTLSRFEPVTDTARAEELSRMLGGGAAALQHAQALLAASRTP
ncbi:MAG: DNA repair protein RecN [Verrucomicrobiales bacterium]|nr:DNA repair protein RecN [Verrucomicrobiales bacterium]